MLSEHPAMIEICKYEVTFCLSPFQLLFSDTHSRSLGQTGNYTIKLFSFLSA